MILGVLGSEKQSQTKPILGKGKGKKAKGFGIMIY